MEHSISRRTLVGTGLAALMAGRARAQPVFRFGLTPVFLDNDAAVIDGLRHALSRGMGREIELVQRRTYQEITGLLLERSVDAAWLCGYPYLQHADLLDLVAVPVWRGSPRYQSYLIVGTEDRAESLTDLQGGTHAFSDPDSNSGYLVTATDLRRMGEQVEGFFSRSIFTFGHRNVVRAVADGLMRSGSVDGYVWEALEVIGQDFHVVFERRAVEIKIDKDEAAPCADLDLRQAHIPSGDVFEIPVVGYAFELAIQIPRGAMERAAKFINGS